MIELLDELNLSEISSSKNKIIEDFIKESEDFKDEIVSELSGRLELLEKSIIIEFSKRTPNIIEPNDLLRDIYEKTYTSFYSGTILIGDFDDLETVMASDFIITMISKCRVISFNTRDELLAVFNFNVNNVTTDFIEILKILRETYIKYEKQCSVLRSKHQLILNSLA